MQNGLNGFSFYGHLDKVADKICALYHVFFNLFHIDLEGRPYGGKSIVQINGWN